VAADPLFSLSYMGVNGGIVIVTADEPSMFSSQNEQDNRWYGIFAKIPVLEPADSQEAKDLVIEGLKISEAYDTPVLLHITTRIAHCKTLVELGERSEGSTGFAYKKDFKKNILMPMNARLRHQAVEQRLELLAEVSESFPATLEVAGPGEAIITSGIDFQYVREAFPEARVLKIGMTHPLPRKKISAFIEAHQGRVRVIESLDPVMEQQIRSWGYTTVTGKDKTGLLYELSVERLRQAFNGQDFPRPPAELPPRPPVLCAGCPHRGIYHSLNKKKAIVHGDIGCYTLGALPPLEAMDTCVCMGASISMANGMNAMLGRQKAEHPPVFATIGDSTFLHSGITPLIDAVYNRLATHVLILDNRVTAMTGHQPNPSTGMGIHGEESPQIDLEILCRSLGITDVDVVTPYDLERINELLEKHMQIDGPSVIISRAPCALIPLYRRSTPYRVDTEKCTFCRACIRTGCPALSAVDGKSHIDAHQCTGCGLCAQVCKFDAIHHLEQTEGSKAHGK
jgi:indolepyruvate ferredoxin oxidoreductase alpha subunit